MFNVEKLELDKVQLAGYSHKGDYMNIGSAFDKLIMNASSQNLLNDYSRIFGIYYDDPKFGRRRSTTFNGMHKRR